MTGSSNDNEEVDDNSNDDNNDFYVGSDDNENYDHIMYIDSNTSELYTFDEVTHSQLANNLIIKIQGKCWRLEKILLDLVTGIDR